MLAKRRKGLSSFLRLLHARRRTKRAMENERLREAFEKWCPVMSWRQSYPSNRRVCRPGERLVVDTLDAALRDREELMAEAAPGDTESVFPC